MSHYLCAQTKSRTSATLVPAVCAQELGREKRGGPLAGSRLVAGTGGASTIQRLYSRTTLFSCAFGLSAFRAFRPFGLSAFRQKAEQRQKHRNKGQQLPAASPATENVGGELMNEQTPPIPTITSSYTRTLLLGKSSIENTSSF
jgi:hypothetical protein